MSAAGKVLEGVQLKASGIKIIPIGDITPNPKNINKHGEDQIARLAEIIKYQGFRSPLIISNLSGLLVSGHGRLEAAKLLGLQALPVMYQDFDSEEQEFAALVSENSIALWAELDFASINAQLPDMGPDFNIDMLGIKDFVLEPADKDIKNTSQELNLDDFDGFAHTCPKCNFGWNDA